MTMTKGGNIKRFKHYFPSPNCRSCWLWPKRNLFIFLLNLKDSLHMMIIWLYYYYLVLKQCTWNTQIKILFQKQFIWKTLWWQGAVQAKQRETSVWSKIRKKNAHRSPEWSKSLSQSRPCNFKYYILKQFNQKKKTLMKQPVKAHGEILFLI